MKSNCSVCRRVSLINNCESQKNFNLVLFTQMIKYKKHRGLRSYFILEQTVTVLWNNV